MKTLLSVFVILVLAATASAQQMTREMESKVVVEKQLQMELQKAAPGQVMVTFDKQPLTGAPYSGEAVTDSVQVLADGNRIVTHNAARVYRDSKGRTRRETLGPDGQVTSISITDPASGKSYTINPRTNTVQGTGIATYSLTRSATSSSGLPGAEVVTVYSAAGQKLSEQLKGPEDAQLPRRVVAGQAVSMGDAGTVSMLTAWPTVEAPTAKESLGQQTIEGVLATGTRTTIVMPAGAIGNERPITIVSEEWTSTDLKVLVMTKHSDPRVGETTYRLTGIDRTEPNPSLFELPAGTTVK